MRRKTQASSGDAASRNRSLSRLLAKICLAGAAVAALSSVASPVASAACPNEEFRTGASALLPDCRAYELVTPTKVNGIPEAGMGFSPEEVAFTTPSAGPNGDSYVFKLLQSSLEGSNGNGFQNLYESKREGQWKTLLTSPTGQQATAMQSGAMSQDHQYKVFEIEASRGGSLSFCEFCNPVYVRYPDGTFHLLGEGTVPAEPDTDGFENGFVDDPRAAPRWITAGGTHQIFFSFVQLISTAPAGAASVYDRTPSGLELISLLPGEIPPTGSSSFAGASEDGSTVLFTNEEDLYARVNNENTLKVASATLGTPHPGGVSADGGKVFYVQEGNIFVYDTEAETAAPVATPGDAVLVNVSKDGSHAYFISETEFVAGVGSAGEPNLYAWDGESIDFVGTVTDEDLAHSHGNPGEYPTGLALWTEGFLDRPAAENANRTLNTARSTADGKFFVFESSAQLTSYLNSGHREIYRYNAATGELICISCSPAQASATGDSELVFLGETGRPPYLSITPMLDVPNLSEDGQQVVFQTQAPLLLGDTNGVLDVYEWRAGALSLLSTGNGAQTSLLTGATPDGTDIFFRTGQTLVPKGQETGALAMYDARIDGGLASQQAEQPLNCIGEACLGQPTPPPGLAAPSSSTFHGKGNVKSRCAQKHRKRHKSKSSKRKHQKKQACKASHRRAGK